MNIAIIVALVVLGIVFLLLEIFFLPGISVAGIAGVLSLSAAVYLSFHWLGHDAGIVCLLASIAAVIFSIWLFIKSKALDRMALKKDIDSTVADEAIGQLRPGQIGTCLSRLAPYGKILVEGLTVEAKAENQIVDEGSRVEIVEVSRQSVLVRPIEAGVLDTASPSQLAPNGEAGVPGHEAGELSNPSHE